MHDAKLGDVLIRSASNGYVVLDEVSQAVLGGRASFSVRLRIAKRFGRDETQSSA